MKSNTLRIEKMINGGYGLGRLQSGQTVLLGNALPGETVSYHIVEKRKKTLFGRVDTVLQQHHQRITPPCIYYDKCGGCDLQHCSYDEQLRLKKQILDELFHKIVQQVLPPIPSPRQFGYRQRIRLTTGKGTTGFLRFRSREIVPIRQCLLAHPAINTVLMDILEHKCFEHLRRNSSEIELLYNPATESVTLLLHLQRKPRPADRSTAIELAGANAKLERIFFTGSAFSLEGPYIAPGALCNSSTFVHHITDAYTQQRPRLTWEIGGFCQVNLGQNDNLVSYVAQCCGDDDQQSILDLFCGMGNFSIALSRPGVFLTGVEGQGASVRCAKRNAEEAGLHNSDFIKGPIDTICRQLAEQHRHFDVTVLDPPRQGIPGLAPILRQLTRKKIIYISCDPATLARDLNQLVDQGFAITSVQPFDMFPQTHHIETVVVLEKSC